tara:strand:- start:291 stop:1292 length:1002 start_codon:yes stop_codon:yes gene_type:complete
MPGLKKGIEQIKMQKGGSQSANSVSKKDRDKLKNFFSGFVKNQPYISKNGKAMEYLDKADKDTIKNLTRVMERAKVQFNRGPDGLPLKKGKQKGNKMKEGGSQSANLVSDKDVAKLKKMMEKMSVKSGAKPKQKLPKSLPKTQGAKMISNRDVESLLKMKEGGNVSSFGKAFAAARKKFLADKGPSVFTFKGKKYNVQTKEDRKTVVKKVSGGRKASERKGKAITKFPQVRAASERKGKAITKVDSPVRRKVPMVSKDELKKLSPVERISLPKIKATEQIASKRGLTSKQAQSLGLTEDKRRPSNRAKKRGKVREIIAKVTGMSRGGTFKGTF